MLAKFVNNNVSGGCSCLVSEPYEFCVCECVGMSALGWRHSPIGAVFCVLWR